MTITKEEKEFLASYQISSYHRFRELERYAYLIEKEPAVKIKLTEK